MICRALEESRVYGRNFSKTCLFLAADSGGISAFLSSERHHSISSPVSLLGFRHLYLGNDAVESNY